MNQKPGSKVLVIEDCRDGHSATGQIGIYEGKFPRGVVVVLSDDDMREFDYESFIRHEAHEEILTPFWSTGEPHPLGDNYPVVMDAKPEPPYWFYTDNPRIRLEDGSVIWGDECWWGDAKTAPPTLEEAQESLEQYKSMMRDLLQELTE